MSDPIVKGVKRSPARPASRQATSTKNRATASKSARPKPLAKRASAADKAPARKATKTGTTASSRAKTAKKPAKSGATGARKAQPARSKGGAQAKTTARKTQRPAAKQPQKSAKPTSKTKQAQAKAAPAATKRAAAAAQQQAKRQPTRDEAAALRAFDRAHKEFVRGHFSEARMLFRAILEKHAGVSEVAARSRTYLNIIETRMRAESSLPRDADSLYDRGVIELNRGEYVAAQELFERALKREPEAAHIHYGLAATRARLGSIDTALESLQRALDIQPTLRIRAQHDQDLFVLRNLPDFERMIFAPRP
ncbi:MAG TPA: tetratricopeptide repeat protein [Pyrinomonadaceae bacterium]|nr:tetratricopeptide repeat protein [Pyrinomonadaceae bacterium]